MGKSVLFKCSKKRIRAKSRSLVPCPSPSRMARALLGPHVDLWPFGGQDLRCHGHWGWRGCLPRSWAA